MDIKETMEVVGIESSLTDPPDEPFVPPEPTPDPIPTETPDSTPVIETPGEENSAEEETEEENTEDESTDGESSGDVASEDQAGELATLFDESSVDNEQDALSGLAGGLDMSGMKMPF